MRSGLSRPPRIGSGTGSPEHHYAGADADADADAEVGADADAEVGDAENDDADRACLPGLAVLEVERADEVIVAPNVL